MKRACQHFQGNTRCNQRQGGTNPGQERAFVRQAESSVRLGARPIDTAGEPSVGVDYGEATVRNPVLAVDESGVLDDRAELRYRLQ